MGPFVCTVFSVRSNTHKEIKGKLIPKQSNASSNYHRALLRFCEFLSKIPAPSAPNNGDDRS